MKSFFGMIDNICFFLYNIPKDNIFRRKFMKIARNDLTISLDYPLEKKYPLNTIAFFDIETTGFNPAYCALYLIGCTYFEGDSWHTVQWFADEKNRNCEIDILESFFAFLAPFETLITFNGTTFDIPFVQKKCKHYGLTHSFKNFVHLDIYRAIRPYKRFLGIENMKLKSIEEFLGFRRKDAFSGKDLIAVYQKYLNTGDGRLYQFLMLHNFEDIKGMLNILPILSYADIFNETFKSVDSYILNTSVSLCLKTDFYMPIPLTKTTDFFTLTTSAYKIELLIPLINGTLKFFYDNPKDYYYLPAEDQAIHKSIGQFVDRDFRQKATLANCYIKKTGVYLPQFNLDQTPAFKYSHQDKVSYFQAETACLEDKNFITRYAKDLISSFMDF